MDTSSWKWFRYDEIFDIKHGFYNKKPEDNPNGDIPFIGATDSNNGVTSHSDLETIAITTKTGDNNNSPLEEKIFENCIAVTNNGSVGYAYYQAKKFTCTHDVNPLYLKGHEINPYIALFLCTLIEKERFRWAYGRKWRPVRMPSSKIKLPVTAEGKPDWKYMEDFVKDQIIPQLPKKAQKVWLKKYDTTPQKQEKMKLNTQDWNSFVLKDLFVMTRGKTLSSDDKEYFEGNIPCVNGTSTNNGVLCYLNEMIEDKGFKKQPVPSLSLCRVGTSGLTFVQTKPYYIADNAFCLKLKEQQSTYVYLFLSTLLDQECVKYCYGRTISSEKYMQTKIKLPVTPEGTPDWQFMEDYIKSLPFSRNIEPSDPNEVVDELIEVKKEMIKLRHELKAHQEAQEVKIVGGNVTYIDNSTNYNIKK